MTSPRHSRLRSPLFFVLLLIPIAAMLVSAYGRQPRMGAISVQPDQQFQRIHGWEAVSEASLRELEPFENRQEVLDELFDKAVDFGLTRVRLHAPSSIENTRDFAAEYRAGRISREEARCAQASTVNDNDNPKVLNPSGFIWTEFDYQLRGAVLPLARRLEARGEHLWLNVQYAAFTNLLCRGYTYHHDDPAEYAEFVVAVYEHLRDVHGLVPDTWEVMLEPDNTPHWSPERLAAATAAAAERLKAAGFTPSFVGPATTDALRSLKYFEPIWQRTSLRPYFTELSYHRYSGASRDAIAAIGDVSRQRGVPTAMLEMIGAGVRELHEDLTLGNVSAWQQFALSWPDRDTGAHYFSLDPTQPAGRRAQLSATGWYLRQYFRALRPDAVRIGATSDDEAFEPVAAVNPGDRMAVVVRASRGGRLTFNGLAPGAYTTSCWTDRAQWERDSDPCDGEVVADDSGVAVATMPDAGVFSLVRVAHVEP